VLPVILRTERLVLDAPTMDDRDLVAEYCTDPVFERFMTLPCNGYMTEAVGAVCDWLFERGNETVHWECIVGNVASASVARKAGFAFTGTAPANVSSRDGTFEESWHGVLLSTDSRAVQPGWPV
jgi:RimJ/RimL family protein N-acetyltransferase